MRTRVCRSRFRKWTKLSRKAHILKILRRLTLIPTRASVLSFRILEASACRFLSRTHLKMSKFYEMRFKPAVTQTYPSSFFNTNFWRSFTQFSSSPEKLLLICCDKRFISVLASTALSNTISFPIFKWIKKEQIN